MGSGWTDPRDLLLSELDLALVHALQEDARAPWARIAQVLDVDAATVARRWAAISEARWAWFTVWPSPEHHSVLSDAALVRVTGELTSERVARWCALPWVLTAERTSAGLCAVAVGRGGLPALEHRIASTFAGPGLHAVVEYAAEIPREDSAWRLRSLSERQVRQVLVRTASATRRARPPRDDVVAEVTALLREDARMSFGAMATRLGVSDATARRTVERLIGEGLVRVGCDVAMPAVGLGRGAVVRIGAWHSPEAVRRVLTHPAVHRVACTIGPAAATVSVRMTSLTELRGIEQAWGNLHVVDRWTVTMPLKRNGHLLADDGRSTGHVDIAW